ncbi:Hypothetical protein SRAE_0000072200, partial [Strongyloides ratti]
VDCAKVCRLEKLVEDRDSVGLEESIVPLRTPFVSGSSRIWVYEDDCETGELESRVKNVRFLYISCIKDSKSWIALSGQGRESYGRLPERSLRMEVVFLA